MVLSFFRRLAAALSLLALTGVAAWAQDFKEIAPKPVPPMEGTPVIVPPAPQAAGANADQVAIPNLKALVLEGYAPDYTRNPVAQSGLVINHLPLLDQPELRAQLQPFLGHAATFGDLSKIQQIVIAWYRAHDRPFVDVSFPEQDVSQGVAQALVTEFHLGKLRAEGNQYFSGDFLISQMRVQPGEAIDYAQLQDDISWLNQNPFRQVSLVAERSDQLGATDLVLKTDDRLPWRFYIGNDDTGTPALSLNRWNLGATWGNAFGLDQQLAYQLTASDDFFDHPGHPTFVAHSLDDIIPLPWRDKLSIFGDYSLAHPLLGPDLGLTGVSGQASFRYIHTLPTLSSILPVPINENVQAGYDFKTSNNNLSFGGVTVSDVTTEVDQFPITYDASIVGNYGSTALSNTLVLSPGGLTAGNRNSFFAQQASNPLAKASYVYDTLSVIETTRMPFDAAWVIKLTGQASSTNLIPSEQLGAGGHDTVRGYNERAANGSNGFLASQELRTPAFHLLDIAEAPDQAQLLAFWDYGSVRDAQFTPGAAGPIKLSSLGVGARYTMGRTVDLRMDYGFQQRALPGAGLGQLLQAALTVSY